MASHPAYLLTLCGRGRRRSWPSPRASSSDGALPLPPIRGDDSGCDGPLTGSRSSLCWRCWAVSSGSVHWPRRARRSTPWPELPTSPSPTPPPASTCARGTARTTGLVFYPGAKVDPRAYVPNLTPLAAAGYPVIILKLPYNIAFFDPNGAYRVMDANPQITRWAVGGHSLGGVVASSVAGSDDPRVGGLLLWASYPNSSIATGRRCRSRPSPGRTTAWPRPPRSTTPRPACPRHPVRRDRRRHPLVLRRLRPAVRRRNPVDHQGQAQREIQAASLDLIQRVEATAR